MNAGFQRSLFERLSLQNHPKHLLSVQYRMNPSISFFPNSEFYRNQIRDADIVRQRMYAKRKYLPGPMFGPYSFINIIGGRDEKDNDGHSRKNNIEVAVIVKIVQNLHKCKNLVYYTQLKHIFFSFRFFVEFVVLYFSIHSLVQVQERPQRRYRVSLCCSST